MDYIDFFYKRITDLRIQKGVSARDMSLSLGQSESYINKTYSDIEKDIEAIIVDYLLMLKDDEGTPLLYRGCV